MAIIRLTLNGEILQEIPLNNAKTTIGRRQTNDVVLDDPAISGTHAVIEAKHNDFFLEDLNSTNGTRVNGQPIKRHFLQNGDEISLAKYKLKIDLKANNQGANPPIVEKRNTLLVSPAPALPATPVKLAFVKILNGNNVGKQLVLNKERTSLGTPGVQVATIIRTNNAYYLTHIEGVKPTLLNDAAIGNEVREMKQGDVISLSGTRLMFSFS